jgi:5-methylcytosine-specific restriction endonuclease McrA
MTTVVALLNQVKNEKIVLPGIQRDFVWEPDRISKLLDSILRGYPVGIALLWETYNDIQYRPFVENYSTDLPFIYHDNESQHGLKLVLDGQQRLQSLFIALYGTYNSRRLYFDVLSGRKLDDLSDERYRFAFLSSPEAKARNAGGLSKGHWTCAADIFTWTSVDKHAFRQAVAAERSLVEDDVIRIEDNLGRFDDALTKDENVLRVSTIDEDLPPNHPARKSEADVLEIFFRINREGTPLSRSDLIFSMLKLNWKESAEQLPEFLRKVNEGHSLGLNTDFVIRSLFAVSDIGAKLDLELLRKQSNIAKLQDNFAKCCAAIQATVDFVVHSCKCGSADLIGGQTTLVPFVYYFFHLPNHEIPNNGVSAARKSFYLFALAKPFSRYGEGRAGAFIRSGIRPKLEGDDHRLSVDDAIEWVRFWERITSVDDLLGANPSLTLHLLQGLHGGKVQYHRNLPEIDHIFPRATLRKKGYREEEINSVANFWILAQGKNRNKSDKDPSKYFADVDDDTLADAAIDRGLLTSYRSYRRFLVGRQREIAERVTSKLHLTDRDIQRLEAGQVEDDDLDGEG